MFTLISHLVGIDVRFLIHDRDTKFSEAFNGYFGRDDGGIVLTPPGAPIANGYCSWCTLLAA